MNFLEIVETAQKEFQKINPDVVYWANECRYVKRIVGDNDYLAGIMKSKPKSFQNAITDVASLNLTLNPALSYAYLVPRKGTICLDISYQGLLYIAQREKRIKKAFCDVVHANDTFEFKGVMEPVVHSYDPFKDRGDKVGAWCSVLLSDDTWQSHVMTIKEIHDIRALSEAWKRMKEKSVWGKHPKAMELKTVIKQASKYWPKLEIENPMLEKAIDISNKTDGFTEYESNAKDINKLLFEGEENVATES